MSRSVSGSSFMRKRSKKGEEGSRSCGPLRMRGNGLSSSCKLRELSESTLIDRSSLSMKASCRGRLLKRSRLLGSIKYRDKLSLSMNSG